MLDEGSLSIREGGRDERIMRCTCGAWMYRGTECMTCALMRGDSDGMGRTDT